MGKSIFEAFNKQFDINTLKQQISECENKNNSGTFEEVPDGKYEVSVKSMELKESRNGQPMLSIVYRVLEGSFKNRLIFSNNVLTTGVGLHNANQTLRSMGTPSSDSVSFEDFVQYGELVEEIFDLVKRYQLEYVVEIESKTGKTGKTFRTYKIIEVFEIE